MTKKQVVWLLIRVAGFWFLWRSVEMAFFTSAYLLTNYGPELPSKPASFLLQPILQAVLYLALGLYCLASGDVFFYLLSREPDQEDK